MKYQANPVIVDAYQIATEAIYFDLSDFWEVRASFSTRELLIPWLCAGNKPHKFTGLKDFRDKDIYESDFIKCPDNWTGEVWWNESDLQWWCGDHKLCDLNNPIVVTNKWQNNIEDFK